MRRVGYLASLVQSYQGQNGFDWWVFDLKQEAVKRLKVSGVPYSIFNPSTFMEGFDKGGFRQRNAIALAGTSKHKMFLIAGTDYGKQVVRAFQQDIGSREYVVQGYDGYTADEAAKLFVENCTKEKVKIMRAPLGLLKFLGLFSKKIAFGAKICEALNDYPEQFAAEETWRELGKPETRSLDYIKKA